MSEIKIEGAAVPEKNEQQVITAARKSHPLFDMRDEENSLSTLLFKTAGDKAVRSHQGVDLGRREHPFNFDMVARFQSANVHHARCIHTKVSSTVGLGFESPADKIRKDSKRTGEPVPDISPEQEEATIDTVLDPLCVHSWQDVLTDVCEDFWQTGNGYLEVIREGNSPEGAIVGLHHIPAREVYPVIEDTDYNRHFEIQGDEDGGSRLFAAFGDLAGFIERIGTNGANFNTLASFDASAVSEVIHLRRPTSLSRWYGFPDWLSAVAYIELMQCLLQHEYDFFLNRGVPEFMLFVLGQKLNSADKNKLQAAMQSVIGLGNSHKSLFLNLDNAETKVQLEKLAMESKGDGNQFAGMSDNLALSIVSAHGVPPLLAGIQIPGKLGATNELVQAMTAFQALVISGAQRIFQRTLTCTLGKEPSLGLSIGDFTLNTILDEIDLQKLDTVARMRQSPQEAEEQGRDLEDGVKKIDPELLNALLGKAVARSG